MKDPIGDINKRITELENFQEQDTTYLSKLEQERNLIVARMQQRMGAIGELKRLNSLENLTKDAELENLIKDAEVVLGEDKK